MKKRAILLSVILIAFLMGCATSRDLKAVRYSLDSKIVAQEKDLSNLREESSTLRKDSDQIDKINQILRKNQADVGADFVDLRASVQRLRGDIEKLKMELATLQSDLKGEESAGVRQKFDDISFRINYIENFLGVRKKTEPGKVSKKSKKKKNTSLKGKVDKEKTYAEAYKTFREGEYKGAREKFREFVKIFPATEYSDNAQFWIGECYYFEKNYEKAILEYENVIKNYPKGNKVPNAFLKQALSFMKLGDKSSAKLLLQRVIKEYPNTSPARIARGKLTTIK